ncbi:MAG TPA: HAD-IA family hydrolase [Wenzhouxiangella sp.]
MTENNSQRAVLFDLDGTLVDTAPDLVNALKALCAHVKKPLAARNDWSGLVSHGAARLIETALGPQDQGTMDRYLAYFLDHYEHHIYEDSHLFDGVRALLAFCRSNGWALGVVTNKKQALAEKILEQAGLSDWFGTLIGGDTVGCSKPDPAPVWAACEALKTRPDQAILVGDDQRDVEAARRAGVMSIVAGWGYGVASIEPELLSHAECCRTPVEVQRVLQLWGPSSVD